MNTALQIWLATLLFALVHSFMATERLKRAVIRTAVSARQYRLIYTIVSLLLTALWLVFIHTLPDHPLYHADGWLHYLLVGMEAAGVVVLAAAFRPIDSMAFVGLGAQHNGIDPFVVNGVYRHVRHPMYSGVMLMLLASPTQSVNSLNMALAVCLYFLIGSGFEERRMIAQHPEYAGYRERVPAFIPCFRCGRTRST